MLKAIDKMCAVAAEDGEVILECGTAAVSLTPEVARYAAADMAYQADRAAEQRRLGLEPIPDEF